MEIREYCNSPYIPTKQLGQYKVVNWCYWWYLVQKYCNKFPFFAFSNKISTFFHYVFPYSGLQRELYDASKAVANSKQLDVKLTSFKAVHFSPVSTPPDTSLLYVNRVSAFGIGLTAMEVHLVVSGVLRIIKGYLGSLDLSHWVWVCLCMFTLSLCAVLDCS